MDKKKVIKLIIKLLRKVVIIILISPIIPIPIYLSYNALEIKIDDPSYLVECKVNIKGFYFWSVFLEDKFYGQVILPDYKRTNEKMEKLHNIDYHYGDSLNYNYTEGIDYNGNPKCYTYNLGTMVIGPFFTKVAIQVYKNNAENKLRDG